MTDSSDHSSLGFDQHFPLAGLRPAAYNPRFLDDEGLAALRASLRLLGVVRPILATQAGIIVAGHQRTRACLAEGITHAPVYTLADVDEGDEVRFNQLHNGTDVELGVSVSVPPHASGWVDVLPAKIVGVAMQPGAPVRHEIHRLVNRYGLWGGAVATADGTVVSGGQYALACMIASRPCRVCYLSTEASAHAAYLSRTYGVFDYSRIASAPWQQTFCQPSRVEGSRVENSPLYQDYVLPTLRKRDRLFDLGCGMGAYVRRLRAAGYSATGWEPYPRTGNTINRDDAVAMTRALIEELARGPFDVGVADSVVNATADVGRAYDVCRGLSAAVKLGGLVHMAGIDRDGWESSALAKGYHRKDGSIRQVHFFDRSGQSAMRVHGGWMFQWANRREDVHTLIETTIGTIERIKIVDGYWRLTARNTRPEGTSVLLAAARREFDPAYPDGAGLGLAAEVVAALARNIGA